MILLNLFLPDERWGNFFLLACQWVRLPLYFGFFLCGAWAWRDLRFLSGACVPDWKRWTAGAIFCSAVYFGLRLWLYRSGYSISGLPLMLADQTIRVLLCMVCSFSVIALFRRYADVSGLFWEKLSLCSFAMYWIQQPVVDVFGQFTRAWEFPCAVKFALVSLATALVSFLLADFLLLRLPFFAPGKKRTR